MHLISWSDEQSTGSADEAYVWRKLYKAVKRITKAVQDLPNVREYKIQCLQNECDVFFVHGLIPTLKHWERTLTKLTLCVPPGELFNLLTLNFCFGRPPLTLEISVLWFSIPWWFSSTTCSPCYARYPLLRRDARRISI